MDVEQVVGSFVVEIGFRQAWPFLGLCDNRPTPAQEARLYIDASWTIEVATSARGTADDDIAWLTAAIALNGRTIDTARVYDDGSLSLTTDTGITLVVSGEPEPDTTGEAWRLTSWHSR
ncbi:DUF6188 family protein [Micromonospora sp. CA-244673]|uniref:DUF6188 family protein n=1 Tax=Micromonospora sp. CA-244673 TaxID=3239958 RepID=UPI003D943DBC